MAKSIESRSAIVWSEGSRLAADLYFPDAAGPHPAILLCHGWGGLKSGLARYAQLFASHGFVCLTFDYRGWGESDGRILPTANAPMLTAAEERTLRVRVVREVVDPLDQQLDIRNAFEFLLGEEGVDNDRVGLWGSSYGGGHVVHFASLEERVHCVVAQVGGYDHPQDDGFKQRARRRAGEKARGTLDPPIPQGVDVVPGLKGTPDIAKMLGHRVVDSALRVRVPTLIIDAEFEELVDRRKHGQRVFEAIRQHAPAEYLTFPCKHYDIYDQYYPAASESALAWFQKHLGH